MSDGRLEQTSEALLFVRFCSFVCSSCDGAANSGATRLLQTAVHSGALGDTAGVYLDKKSESLKVIQQLRNEAHRFGITFHRNLRSKGAIVSELDGIKGIGEKTATQLLRHFKTVAKIKEANLDALITQVGPAKASILYEHFH